MCDFIFKLEYSSDSLSSTTKSFEPINITPLPTVQSPDQQVSVWDDPFLKSSLIGTCVSLLACFVLCLLLFSVAQHAMKVWSKVDELWAQSQREKTVRTCEFLIV